MTETCCVAAPTFLGGVKKTWYGSTTVSTSLPSGVILAAAHSGWFRASSGLHQAQIKKHLNLSFDKGESHKKRHLVQMPVFQFHREVRRIGAADNFSGKLGDALSSPHLHECVHKRAFGFRANAGYVLVSV